MDMVQKWKFLLQMRDQKEEYQVGWEQLLWHQWEYLINGLLQRKNIKSMEQFKYKRDFDLFYINIYF